MSIHGKSLQIRKITYLAILTAIVFVLQFISLAMRFSTFSLTFVLVPIIIGAALLGVWSGAWLGLVFALAVFATGDAALFLQVNVFGTIVTVILKGVLAGLASGAVYKLIERYNRYAAIICSAVVAPVVNTGVFFLGSVLFFRDYIMSLNLGEYLVPVILVYFIGINFFIELGVNIVLSPVIYKVINLYKRA